MFSSEGGGARKTARMYYTPPCLFIRFLTLFCCAAGTSRARCLLRRDMQRSPAKLGYASPLRALAPPTSSPALQTHSSTPSRLWPSLVRCVSVPSPSRVLLPRFHPIDPLPSPVSAISLFWLPLLCSSGRFPSTPTPSLHTCRLPLQTVNGPPNPLPHRLMWPVGAFGGTYAGHLIPCRPSGAATHDRHRRLPGDTHRRGQQADHQAQLPRYGDLPTYTLLPEGCGFRPPLP